MKMLLPIRKVADRIGRGKSWIREEVKREGSDFPKPVDLEGYLRAVWDSEEVDAWVNARMARAKGKHVCTDVENRV